MASFAFLFNHPFRITACHPSPSTLYPCILQFVFSPTHPYLFLPIHPSVSPSPRQSWSIFLPLIPSSTRPSIHPPNQTLTPPSAYSSTCSSTYPSIHAPRHPPTPPSTRPSILHQAVSAERRGGSGEDLIRFPEGLWCGLSRSLGPAWLSPRARTPAPVSEAELASREALSLGTEAELPNSLPGDDQDECLLLPGELCQHLCINTAGAYRCACFPGFSLQGDGRTCRPGEGPGGGGGRACQQGAVRCRMGVSPAPPAMHT